MKKIVSSAVFIVLLLGCIMEAGVVFRPFNIDISLQQIKTFHSLEKDSIDVIAYGSSRCWRGFNTVEFRDRFGVSAYNYGNNWQGINTTLLFLKDSLNTQSPKVAFVETGMIAFPVRDVDLTGEIYYTKEIPWSESKMEYLKQCFGNEPERYLSYFVPFVAFHSNWESLASIELVENTKDLKSFTNSLGYVAINEVTPLTMTYNKDHEEEPGGGVL